jgi:hypothetical protein
MSVIISFVSISMLALTPTIMHCQASDLGVQNVFVIGASHAILDDGVFRGKIVIENCFAARCPTGAGWFRILPNEEGKKGGHVSFLLSKFFHCARDDIDC